MSGSQGRAARIVARQGHRQGTRRAAPRRSNSNYRPGKSVARPTPTILLSFAIGLSFPLATNLITLPGLNGTTHYAGLPIIVPTYDIRSSDIARKLTRSPFIHRSAHPAIQLSRNRLSLSSGQLNDRLIRSSLVKLTSNIISNG